MARHGRSGDGTRATTSRPWSATCWRTWRGSSPLRRSTMPRMPVERFHQALSTELDALRERGTLKGAESVITRVLPAAGERGPRYLLAGPPGDSDQPFLKM